MCDRCLDKHVYELNEAVKVSVLVVCVNFFVTSVLIQATLGWLTHEHAFLMHCSHTNSTWFIHTEPDTTDVPMPFEQSGMSQTRNPGGLHGPCMARHKCRYHMEWKSVVRMGNESNKVYKAIYKNVYRPLIDVSLGSLHACCPFCMHTQNTQACMQPRTHPRTHAHAPAHTRTLHARARTHACPYMHTNGHVW